MGPTETGTRPLERLRFGCGVGVLVIGPLFSDPGMQSGAVDGDLTGDNDSADHLAFAFAAGLSLYVVRFAAIIWLVRRA